VEGVWKFSGKDPHARIVYASKKKATLGCRSFTFAVQK